VKYLIPILTILLLLLGLLTLLGSIFSGVSFYTLVLTFSTVFGIVAYLSNKKIGLTIILFVSIAWLLRYFERSGFLLLHDTENVSMWILVIPIISVSIPLFFLSYIYRQRLLNKSVNLKWLTMLFLLIPSLAFLSFTRKAHTNEYNCWYYIDQSSEDYMITFATTPEHLFEIYSSSKQLKDFIQNNGIKDQYREGIYCPETKVKIITKFKKITSISIIGFHNTTTNKYYKFPKSVDIDYNQLRGDKSILEPDFEL
jgi:hypothetical protein